MNQQVVSRADVGGATTFSPRDLMLGKQWTSALFMTYSMSLSFFEAVPLSDLSKSAQSVTILADLAGYSASLSEEGAVDVGRTYEVVPLSLEGGVFHPKVAVLATKGGDVRAMIGSGNLSFGGWGRNAEVAELLVPGKDSQAYVDLASFLSALADATGPGSRLRTSRFPDLSPHIGACRRAASAGGSGRKRVLHTLTGPLDEQIAELAHGLGGATTITIVSPYFSRHYGVARLAATLDCSEIAVSVSPNAPSCFDFIAAREAGLNARPVISDLFNDPRPLHAKVLDIECRKGGIIVTGSANATLPAISGRNIEVVVARPVGRSSSLGWRPSGTHSGAVGEVDPDERPAGSCLVARIEQGRIIGQMFGVSSPSGEWFANARSASRLQHLGQIAVGPQGYFEFPLKNFDPTEVHSSAQLCLERHGEDVRGWLMQKDLLKAISEKGPIARSAARLLGGGSTADLKAVLDFLAGSPASLLEAARRQAGGRKDGQDDKEKPNVTIRSERTEPVGAFIDESSWTGTVGETSFSNLMDALVRHFASTLPVPEDDDDDDDDDGASAGKSRKRSHQRRGRQRVSTQTFRRPFCKMVEALAEVPAGPDRTRCLYTLFDLVVQIAPRCDDAEALTVECLMRWLDLVAEGRPLRQPPETLARMAAATLVKMVMDGSRTPDACHEILQIMFGGEPDEATLRLIEPNQFGLDERRLAPAATPEGWHAAWAALLGSTTQWSRINALEAAVRQGHPWDAPPGASPAEIKLLRRVASGEASRDRLVVLRRMPRRNTACPGLRCNMVLPTGDQSRLKASRLATCTSCGRIILNLSI